MATAGELSPIKGGRDKRGTDKEDCVCETIIRTGSWLNSLPSVAVVPAYEIIIS